MDMGVGQNAQEINSDPQRQERVPVAPSEGRCKKGSSALGPSSMTSQRTPANRAERHGSITSTQTRKQWNNVQITLKFSSKNKLVKPNSR